ncbi:MAG TPA: bifunctional nuclease family protein [Flavobacteriales bacterium]|nr:bifunctional nuclease family protein [Flavobacteriales bacterium]HRE95767.1 bifunctional nuclease family protein [Flavobacteriales bacterium]HRJ35599.1 bifunctional nuclease family protein [Flavobacteriales bacterium]HRJ38722.1 bifunctional nuclease family protein [Flavobacteriales bacterium]
MEKIKLEIVGLSYSQTQSGAYALVLGEAGGKRRLPIIIGGFEAQAIAIELEKMTPSRPLTHDLFRSFCERFAVNVKEVIIYNLVEGIFYAKVMCEGEDGKTAEIDARTSDAIALAVRFSCPIYTYEFILSSAGIILDEEAVRSTADEDDEIDEEMDLGELTHPADFSKMSVNELEKGLQEAIDNEDYERASRIRDELSNRKNN